ncbi:hypothetical protein [Aeromonas sp. sif2416]|uniref:hypothetical protein n=1 Tax=Aeromonas sp. sif2416 TaxID=2854793 RepID=UPI00210CA369|nr:hypothetical protein [Aeromonas sp. sif2416]
MIAATDTQHRQGIGQHLDLISLLDNYLCPAHVTVGGDEPQIEYGDGKAGHHPEKTAELEALLPRTVGNLKTTGVDKETLWLIAKLT